jgi:hypothetical protein
VPGPRVDSKTARIPSRGRGKHDRHGEIATAQCIKRLDLLSKSPSKAPINSANPSSDVLVKYPG